MMDIDLNDFSGGPHWLSGPGKVDRNAIRAKHRDAYMSTRERKITPASAEVIAKLQAAIDNYNNRSQALIDKRNGKDPEAKNIIAVFTHAFYILDRTEPMVRDIIEGDLMDVAGLPGKVRGTVKAGKQVADKIAAIRTEAIKQAFRYLREHLPSDI